MGIRCGRLLLGPALLALSPDDGVNRLIRAGWDGPAPAVFACDGDRHNVGLFALLEYMRWIGCAVDGGALRMPVAQARGGVHRLVECGVACAGSQVVAVGLFGTVVAVHGREYSRSRNGRQHKSTSQLEGSFCD